MNPAQYPLRSSVARSAKRGVGHYVRDAGRRSAKRLAQAILPKSVVVWQGHTSRNASTSGRRRVALTFDDGPGDLTRAYLDVLGRFGARSVSDTGLKPLLLPH